MATDPELEADIATAGSMIWESAIAFYRSRGMTQADAEATAEKLLSSPWPAHWSPLPTFDEL